MRRPLRTRTAAALVLASLTFAASPALAKPAAKGSAKAACLAAHEEALALRGAQKPHAARERLVACARAECPTVVRKECAEQLALVDKDAPTVALEARDEAGMDTTAVKVTMDGQPLADHLTGSAVDVEPGEHVFRFERADGKALEQRVLVVEGDKNRKVTADFASLVPKPPPGGEGTPVGPPESHAVPTLAYVAGGVSIVALGSFVVFALTGKGSEKDLASSCGPNCSDEQLSPVKRDYAIADVSLVIGLVAAAAAVVLAWPAIAGSPQSTASISRRPADRPWMPRVTVRALP